MPLNNFLLINKEPYLLEEKISKISTSVPDHEICHHYEVETFLDDFHRSDLFSNSKKILILDYMNRTDLKVLVDLCEVPSDDVLVFVDNGGLSSVRAYAHLKAACKVVKVDPLSEKEAKIWVSNYLKEQGYTCGHEVVNMLVSRRGKDLWSIVNEVRKISHIAKDNNISNELCNRLVYRAGESKFFDFIDHFCHKRAKEVIEELSNIDERSYGGLLHMLQGQFEKLYRISIYRSQKMEHEDIASLMGFPTFILKTKYYTALAHFNKIKILKVVDILNELEMKLRTLQYNKSVIFEAYILKCFSI